MLRAATITKKRVTTIATEHRLKSHPRQRIHLEAINQLASLAPKAEHTQ